MKTLTIPIDNEVIKQILQDRDLTENETLLQKEIVTLKKQLKSLQKKNENLIKQNEFLKARVPTQQETQRARDLIEELIAIFNVDIHYSCE